MRSSALSGYPVTAIVPTVNYLQLIGYERDAVNKNKGFRKG